jgi:hypothetical protein
MDSIIHYGIKCHECQVFPIVGIRYKCLKCENFDLCEQCEGKVGENHGHILLKLRNTYQEELYKNKYNIKDEKLKVPVSRRPTFNCVNPSLNFKTTNNNNFINIPIKLLNTGRVNWPLPCYFACQEQLSEIKGEKIKIIKSTMEPGKDIDLKVKIDLSNIKKTGDYKSIWCLEDEKGVAFGPKVTINIKDIFQEKLKLKPYYLIKKLDMGNKGFKPITTDQLLAKKNNL